MYGYTLHHIGEYKFETRFNGYHIYHSLNFNYEFPRNRCQTSFAYQFHLPGTIVEPIASQRTSLIKGRM